MNHFFNTSCNLDVQKNHLDTLIQKYHEVLSSTLDKLGSNYIPTLEDVYKEIQNKIDHGKYIFSKKWAEFNF